VKNLLASYADRLAAAGLTKPDGVLMAALDDRLEWSAQRAPDAADPRRDIMERVFARLNISALLLARPSGAFQEIIATLARRALTEAQSGKPASITPGDCETRTFLHDIPAVRGLSAQGIIEALMRRKGCVLLDRHGAAHVAAFGTVSPEQAFVTMSSICFACFVAYFAAHLRDLRLGALSAERREEFARIAALLPPERLDAPELAAGPFADEDAARAAIIHAGRRTVEHGLVDSYFGNISYRLPGKDSDLILISQTGSSLDDLAACIDPCRMDGHSCAALTASSEFSAHKAIYEGCGARAILHGHPRFAVILSLDCERLDCPGLGECHRACRTPRGVTLNGRDIGIPIVPGEVGTGPFGLCNTLPPALLEGGGRRGAIVYGHGLFSLGRVDFRDAFATLMEVEHCCREEYFRRAAALG
jgi:ribulose-5-phosphate 4-epimerase/fuculose-1-phosphate aldolase